MPTQAFAPYQILLIDDEPEILKLTKMIFQSEGIQDVIAIDDSQQVIPFLSEARTSVIFLDLMMPHLSGQELIQEIITRFPSVPVIVMTAVDDVETAVECIKAGAFDYLVKPLEAGRLTSSLYKALKLHSLDDDKTGAEHTFPTDRLDTAEAFKRIITCSKKMQPIFHYAEVVAPSHHPVLITGETGTGKELMAQAIHSLSKVSGEFVALNVAGLDDVMFSDTLFGHKKGSFTGADTVREGLVGKAAGGTLFLDEIGDLNQLSQIKLLRLLQEEEYYPLGSDTVKSSSARMIVATNRNLEKLMEEGTFRKDLYYRLCMYHIHLPPLRERLDDIPLLLDHFIVEAAKSLNKSRPNRSREVSDLLASLLLPGNTRELQAIVFDAMARHHSGALSYSHFSTIVRALPVSAVDADIEETDPLKILFGKFPTFKEMEEFLIARAWKLAQGKTGAAASLLGISRQGLHKRFRAARQAGIGGRP